jgi:hypothetical protein
MDIENSSRHQLAKLWSAKSGHTGDGGGGGGGGREVENDSSVHSQKSLFIHYIVHNVFSFLPSFALPQQC